jgi:hypothetical protein
VLVGPTYLDEIERIPWPSATVRYLQKYANKTAASGSYVYFDDSSLKAAIFGQPVQRELAEFILSLNRDINCFFLVERERTDLFKGTFLAPVDIADAARYAWRILNEPRPDVLVFHNHPHELFTYVLLRAALHLGVAVFLVHYAALPWRMSVSRYRDDGSLQKLQLARDSSEGERNSVLGYMQRLQQHHEAAIPFADRKLIAADSSALYLGDELRALLRGSVPRNILRMAKKWLAYRSFRRSVASTEGKPYVVFLMHYQPEETTTPRGDIFAQQLNALLRLRSELPDGVSILVKENKATFRAPLVLAVDVRSREFYRALGSLPKTYLVPLQRDTFDLVDNSLAVATITGSVGLEALCRGKKVIIFGEANYKHFTGVIDLGGALGANKLASLRDDAAHDTVATESDLMQELLRSVGPAEEANHANLRSQQAATVDAFRYLADHVRALIGIRDGERAHG